MPHSKQVAKPKPTEHKTALLPKPVPILIAQGYEPWPTFAKDGTWHYDGDGTWHRVPVIYN